MTLPVFPMGLGFNCVGFNGTLNLQLDPAQNVLT